MAFDFLEDSFRKEYNSIKHGLRVHSSPFHATWGPEEKPGVPAPKEKRQVLGTSDFGSNFLDAEKLIRESSHHIRFEYHRRNWNPEDLAHGLRMISYSIKNVVSFLKIANGVPADQVRFRWPSEDEAFDETHKRSIQMGLYHMKGRPRIPQVNEGLFKPFTKDEIRDCFSKGKLLGRWRWRFSSEEE